ncbi:hypothetical protein DFR48_10223 [Ciceribacter lividus]|uniref:MYXO-CTERM domain-containing protein n=2 Tax=Ciceribacter lividus TaxID=1197950 RepID=A0A6I7HR30_9HYPH|nr:hypothetical protein DFR48_10223 [Ciceribacter lividus]
MPMRRILTLVGAIAVVMGLVWIGQGSGYFPYPAASFMIDQSPWIAYGAGLAILGLVLIVIARRTAR